MIINETKEVRELFGRFRIEEMQLKYSTARSEASRAKQRTELMITNSD